MYISILDETVAKLGVEFAGPMGTIDVNFKMVDNLKSCIDKFEADAAPHHALAFSLQERVCNWMGPVKELAEEVEEKENQKWFCFSVTDSGNGFELEQLEKMLQSHKDKEANLDNITSTKLSLFLCVELCRRLGGFMGLASTPYQGTVFHVGIPVDVLTMDQAYARASDDSLVGAAKPIVVSGPILIVGDEDHALDSQLRKQCNKFGLDVDIIKASSSSEVMSSYLGDITPSVVILGTSDATNAPISDILLFHIFLTFFVVFLADNNASGTNGLEVLSKIRKIEHERKLLNSYVVSYTADIADNGSTLLLKAGGNEVMMKPPPSDFIPNLARRFKMETTPNLDEMLMASRFV